MLLCSCENIWTNSPHECNFLHDMPIKTPLIWCCPRARMSSTSREREKLQPGLLVTVHIVLPPQDGASSKTLTRCQIIFFCTKDPCRLKWSEPLIPSELIIGESWFLFVLIRSISGCWVTVSCSSRCVRAVSACNRLHFVLQMWGDCALHHPATRWSSRTEHWLLYLSPLHFFFFLSVGLHLKWPWVSCTFSRSRLKKKKRLMSYLTAFCGDFVNF